MIRAFDGSAEFEEPKLTFFTDPEGQYDYDKFIQNSGNVITPGHKSGGNEQTIVSKPFSRKPVLSPGLNAGAAVNFRNPFQNHGSNAMYRSILGPLTDDNKFQPSSGSTTYVSQSAVSEKDGKSSLYSLLSLNDEYKSSQNSTESTRLESARAQLIMRSYFKAFTVVAVITLLVFICPIITTVMEITCISSSTICFPRYEIQTSKTLPFEQGYSILNVFSMRGIKPPTSVLNDKENILTTASRLLQTFSEKILDSPIDLAIIQRKLQYIFQNKEKVIFKIGHLGYCKKTDTATFSKVMCHSFFENGFDLFSVFMKDIFYELSLDEIDGDPEVISGIFVDSYKRFIDGQTITDANFDQVTQFGYYSTMLSKYMTWVTLIQFGFDIFTLTLCSIVFFHLKNKTSLASIKKIKNVVGKSLTPVDQSKNTTSKLINTLLTLASITLFISLILKVSVIIYEIKYLEKIEVVLNSLNLQIFEGIKLISSGMTIDIINCLLHLLITCLLMIVIFFKPWVMKIII